MKAVIVATWIILLTILGACSGYEALLLKPEAEHTSEITVSAADGATLILIPAGDFVMGSAATDSAAAADELPQRTVYLDAFWLDQTEVTNAMYARCVAAGACAPLVTPRPDMEARPQTPVQGVPWPHAVNYCTWVGRRLPTEAEWEKAARGTDGRLYPWGNGLDDAMQVNMDFRRGDVVDVGQSPDDRSPYGVLDMAGNVSEWVADWYDADYYASAPGANPPGPDWGLERGLRGGAWNRAARGVRAANRFHAFPDRNDFDGFRCALDAKL